MARPLHRVGRVLFATTIVLSLDTADPAPADAAEVCSTWEVEYALTGTMQLTDTPLRKGDGAHKVGPGTVVLRYGVADGSVTMLSYSVPATFTVVAKAFGSTTSVATSFVTRATPDACGVAARGAVRDGKVQWTSKVRALRTDGTLTCSGRFCGSFGAPPPGTSELHFGPADLMFRAFELSKDGKRFTMPYTFASKTERPRQTSFVALTGRESKRTCVAPAKPCP